MADSGALGSLFELAGPISIFVAGIVSDRFLNTRRNPISVVCLTLAAVLLCVMDALPHTATMLGGCLFLVGLMLFAPDALVSGTSAVDFGTKKAAATAAGLINGCGSIGAILGGTLPGVLHDRYGWNAVFGVLAVTLFISAALLAYKWNALPESRSLPSGASPTAPKK
ncbi:MAG TPA: MFS transporter, partial [Candidatus Limnocylindria bacterium]|nr:MFS transporter [Candidatus Limnocylindria bacterium]